MDTTKNTIEIFNKCATSYQEKFMDVTLYHDTLDLFCDYIKNDNADIIDVACGPGNITRYLLNRNQNFKITGIDLAPNMIELAKINNPQADFMLMDARDIGKLNNKYDGVMCSFCLPYLSKDEALLYIKEARTILQPGGVLYLSTMEDDNSKSEFKTGSTGDQMFMNFHEGEYLTKALEENNFKILNLKRQNYPEKDGSKTIDLIIIAALK